jgi:hypothetical protein
LLACASAAAWSQVSGQRCDSSAGPQIVSGIYDRIRADKGLAPQVSHINVVAAYFDPNDNTFSVKFQGWADSWNDYDKVRGIGMAASCVRSVNVNLFLEEPPSRDSLFRSSSGCASGTKPCGDVCIPVGDACGLSTSAIVFYPRLRIDDGLASNSTAAFSRRSE